MKTGDAIILSHFTAHQFNGMFTLGFSSGVNVSMFPMGSSDWTKDNDYRNGMMISGADQRTLQNIVEHVNLALKHQGYPNCQVFKVEQMKIE